MKKKEHNNVLHHYNDYKVEEADDEMHVILLHLWIFKLNLY